MLIIESWGLGLWSLMPLSTIFQLIVAVSFTGGGNRSTLRKPQTCCKSPTNIIIQCLSSTPRLSRIQTVSGDRHWLHW